jgi:hypothetical protein
MIFVHNIFQVCHFTDKTPGCAFLLKKVEYWNRGFSLVFKYYFNEKNKEYELIDDFYVATFQQHLHMEYIVTNKFYPWIWIINNIFLISTNYQLNLPHGQLFQNFLCILFWINEITCIFSFWDYCVIIKFDVNTAIWLVDPPGATLVIFDNLGLYCDFANIFIRQRQIQIVPWNNSN